MTDPLAQRLMGIGEAAIAKKNDAALRGRAPPRSR
jgi:hypothetical protein